MTIIVKFGEGIIMNQEAIVTAEKNRLEVERIGDPVIRSLKGYRSSRSSRLQFSNFSEESK